MRVAFCGLASNNDEDDDDDTVGGVASEMVSIRDVVETLLRDRVNVLSSSSDWVDGGEPTTKCGSVRLRFRFTGFVCFTDLVRES